MRWHRYSTTELCSRRPAFDSRFEVLCWSCSPLSSQCFPVLSIFYWKMLNVFFCRNEKIFKYELSTMKWFVQYFPSLLKLYNSFVREMCFTSRNHNSYLPYRSLVQVFRCSLQSFYAWRISNFILPPFLMFLFSSCDKPFIASIFCHQKKVLVKKIEQFCPKALGKK